MPGGLESEADAEFYTLTELHAKMVEFSGDLVFILSKGLHKLHELL